MLELQAQPMAACLSFTRHTLMSSVGKIKANTIEGAHPSATPDGLFPEALSTLSPGHQGLIRGSSSLGVGLSVCPVDRGEESRSRIRRLRGSTARSFRPAEVPKHLKARPVMAELRRGLGQEREVKARTGWLLQAEQS